MTTDRELLELAAKAAGHKWDAVTRDGWLKTVITDEGDYTIWNPLSDDGDALRLAVTIGLVVNCSRPSAGEPFKPHHVGQVDFSDPYAATRRAIVRAAAEIGRNMK